MASERGSSPWAQAPSRNGARYTQIRTTPRGEASHGEREGQQPLGSSAEREKWTPWERIRTLSEIDVEFPVFTEEPFLYQEIGPKALELQSLGMNYSQIAETLHVTDKTVAKGIRYVRRMQEASRPKSIRWRRSKEPGRAPSRRIVFDDD
jgi:hypothetical protein